MKAWLSVCLALVAWCPLVAQAGGAFDGSFLADRRPESVIYLQLMQQGREVSGVLMRVAPAAKQGTQDQRIRVRGTADGARILLELGGEAVKVERQGANLVMAVPANGGGLISVVLVPADDAAFNQAVARLKGEVLVRAERKAEAERTLQANIKTAEALGSRFAELVRGMESTLIGTQLEDIQRRTQEVSRSVDGLLKALEKLKALAAVRPMTCDHLQYKVGQQLEIGLQHEYGVQVEFRARLIREFRKDLAGRLAKVEPLAKEARALAQTLQQRLAGLEGRSVWLQRKPGDEKAALAAYEGQAQAAHAALPGLDAELERLEARGKAIVAEGEAVVRDLKAQVRCGGN